MFRKASLRFFACVWVSDTDSEEETPSGFLPIHFGSKKQKIGADAVSAAEIVAAHVGLKSGGLPMQSVVNIFNVKNSRIELRIDNNAAVRHVVKSPSDSVFFTLKAVNARHALLRDSHKAGLFNCTRVPTHLNRSDLGTKALGKLELERARRMAGLIPPPNSVEPVASVWERYNAGQNMNKRMPRQRLATQQEADKSAFLSTIFTDFSVLI